MLHAIISVMHKFSGILMPYVGGNFMQFYQRLRDLREDADKNQTEIADILQTTRQQYARWENGDYQMPMEHYKTLARYYNVSLDYLAGLVDTPRKLY